MITKHSRVRWAVIYVPGCRRVSVCWTWVSDCDCGSYDGGWGSPLHCVGHRGTYCVNYNKHTIQGVTSGHYFIHSCFNSKIWAPEYQFQKAQFVTTYAEGPGKELIPHYEKNIFTETTSNTKRISNFANIASSEYFNVECYRGVWHLLARVFASTIWTVGARPWTIPPMTVTSSTQSTNNWDDMHNTHTLNMPGTQSMAKHLMAETECVKNYNTTWHCIDHLFAHKSVVS